MTSGRETILAAREKEFEHKKHFSLEQEKSRSSINNFHYIQDNDIDNA